MNKSFIRVSAACPKTNVSDVSYNLENIKLCIDNAQEDGSKVVVFPELSLTSYTCGDLFLHNTLIEASYDGIKQICDYSITRDLLIIIGSPVLNNACLYNCGVAIHKGKVLGIVPKSYIPNYSEFYEKRWFTEGFEITGRTIDLPFQKEIPFGVDLLFKSDKFVFGIEICEDLWVTIPPSSYLALQGANIICNLSASNELVSKSDYRRSLVSNQSARALCSYIYTSSGVHESTTDLLFGGHMLISENGSILNENKRFQRDNQVISSLIDIGRLTGERIRNVSFRDSLKLCPYTCRVIDFHLNDRTIVEFNRFVDKHPFVPKDESATEKRCDEIFNIQMNALAKRLVHTGLKKAVIGISGGLDSTLALLVVIKTFDMLDIPRKNIVTVTMPGFGTTDRTYNNAVTLCKELGCDFREINIVDSCLQHFKDIGHSAETHDVTYENVQARERTQILMDIANKEGGISIGTGDLSELAIGWCTYNGDHMSMYSVNCSIPKTLVRFLVKYAADYQFEETIRNVLYDINATPVSPELLPKDAEGNIAQKTEDIVGPYELHDFFLYHLMKSGSSPEKIFFLAKHAFKDDYTEDVIKMWLDKFIRRFFNAQFKRSALPDGPKVGTISLSPRGDLRMPSDASSNTWL